MIRFIIRRNPGIRSSLAAEAALLRLAVVPLSLTVTAGGAGAEVDVPISVGILLLPLFDNAADAAGGVDVAGGVDGAGGVFRFMWTCTSPMSTDYSRLVLNVGV